MPRLYPNFGAEEGDAPPVNDPRPVLRHLLTAWERLFTANHAFSDVDDGHLVAWLNTPRAQAEAQRAGLRLWGSPPETVDVVHDKAFCARVVAAHKLSPPGLLATITVIDPADVDVDALAAACVAPPTWPGAGVRGFAFKPRFGSSGRGRVDSRRSPSEWQAALPRLKARGGVVVEPWFARTLDLSAVWRIDDDGGLTLLGTTRAVVSGSGVWRAAELVVDDDGVPRSAVDGRVSSWDQRLVDDSRVVVEAAAAAGHRGPCGVDAFVCEGPDGAPLLRLVELNARFTAGLVAVVLARALDRAPPRSTLVFDPSTSPALISLGESKTRTSRSAPPSE